MSPKVLVVCATHHGATRGSAERIAATVTGSEIEATVRNAREAGDPRPYDAFVIGSAAYLFPLALAPPGQLGGLT